MHICVVFIHVYIIYAEKRPNNQLEVDRKSLPDGIHDHYSWCQDLPQANPRSRVVNLVHEDEGKPCSSSKI